MAFMKSTSTLDHLLNGSGLLWRGRQATQMPSRSTHFPVLDKQLPGGGWPTGAVIELMPQLEGMGEVRLVLPALKAWCEEGRTVAWINPPHIPFAPSLARAGVSLSQLLWVAAEGERDAWWASEQLLREGAAAVLLWSAVQADRPLRRLQLAAEAGRSCAFLYRPPQAIPDSSPAALRVRLSPDAVGLRLDLLKVRGGSPASLSVPLPPSVP